MKDQQKKYIIHFALLGCILIFLQVMMAFMSVFVNLDRMTESTATSLLSSTNREIMENLNNRFTRMIKVGNQIAGEEKFRSYDRTETSLPQETKVQTELSIGQALANYTALDDFCDCCIIYRDNTYLGQIDAHTMDLYTMDNIYETFSEMSDRDSENFATGYNDDYSRIYYTKTINSNAFILVSILTDSLNTIFYDAEENYNLILHMSTQDYHILYSGDKDELKSNQLDPDLVQTIENSNHTSIEMRGEVIASDTCLNGFRITSTIMENSLSSENGNLRALYLIISGCVIVASIILLVRLCRLYIKRSNELEKIENNIEDYTDLDDININI